jgi:hypothetical protein
VAQRYGVHAESTPAVILVSTLASTVTASLLLSTDLPPFPRWVTGAA